MMQHCGSCSVLSQVVIAHRHEYTSRCVSAVRMSRKQGASLRKAMPRPSGSIVRSSTVVVRRTSRVVTTRTSVSNAGAGGLITIGSSDGARSVTDASRIRGCDAGLTSHAAAIAQANMPHARAEPVARLARWCCRIATRSSGSLSRGSVTAILRVGFQLGNRALHSPIELIRRELQRESKLCQCSGRCDAKPQRLALVLLKLRDADHEVIFQVARMRSQLRWRGRALLASDLPFLRTQSIQHDSPQRGRHPCIDRGTTVKFGQRANHTQEQLMGRILTGHLVQPAPTVCQMNCPCMPRTIHRRKRCFITPPDTKAQPAHVLRVAGVCPRNL